MSVFVHVGLRVFGVLLPQRKKDLSQF